METIIQDALKPKKEEKHGMESIVKNAMKHTTMRIVGTVVINEGKEERDRFVFNGHRGYLDEWAKINRIHTQKNTDYSGGGRKEDDPLANFKGSEEFGIDTGIGIILRMSDKFQRVKAFYKNGKMAVKGEGIKDAMRDIANYALLYNALLVEKDSK